MSKRREFGVRCGRSKLLNDTQETFLVDNVRRKDRGNDGMTKSEIVDMVQDLKPGLNRKSAADAYDRTVKTKHHQVLTGIVSAQATTTKRSAVTVGQQYRWHTLVESMFTRLVKLNVMETGEGDVPESWRPNFLRIMKHFVLNLDEECVAAADGSVRIIGDKEKKKHEKNIHDSRTTMTMVRCGTAGGNCGPTFFLCAGERVKTGFTDEFLTNNGAQPGSSVVMTPNAFMTQDAWSIIVPKLIVGIGQMPHIKDHPHFCKFMSLDGFKVHVNSAVDLQRFYDARFMIAKEEADNSHVVQPFDRHPARADKACMRDLLGLLRSSTGITRGVVCQYGLVQVGLGALRHCKEHPDLWEGSFKLCNLHPDHRLPFAEWLEKIDHFLMSGESFKLETVDKFHLLPPLWIGMSPQERKAVVAIIGDHDGEYTADCLVRLHEDCKLAYADMQKIRIGYDIAIEDPATLDRTDAPPETTVAIAPAPKPESSRMSRGLITFQLHPPGMTGMELFEHMLAYGKRRVPRPTALDRARCKCRSHFRVSDWLDVEMSNEQCVICDPTPEDLTMREILRDSGGDGATKKMSQRKLDSSGFVNAFSCEANSPHRIARLKAGLQLAKSLAEISRITALENKGKKEEEEAGFATLVDSVIQKLIDKRGEVYRLTIPEIRAVAQVKFMKPIKTGRKVAVLAELQKLHESFPRVLGDACNNIPMLFEAPSGPVASADEPGQMPSDADPAATSSGALSQIDPGCAFNVHNNDEHDGIMDGMDPNIVAALQYAMGMLNTSTSMNQHDFSV